MIISENKNIHSFDAVDGFGLVSPTANNYLTVKSGVILNGVTTTAFTVPTGKKIALTTTQVILGYSNVAQPTVGQSGTLGTTSYTYGITWEGADGVHSGGSITRTTAAGNATLDGTNFNTIIWTQLVTPPNNITTYTIWRTASSGSPSSTGIIGTVSGSTISFNDTGLPGGGETYPTGGAVGLQRVYNDGTTDHTFGPNLSANAATTTFVSATECVFIFGPGESLKIRGTSNNGAQYVASAIEFDANVPVFTRSVTNPSSGFTTLYTVPAGKTARLFLPNPGTQGWFGYRNDSGVAVSVQVYVVPSGGNTGLSTQLSATAVQSISNGAAATFAAGPARLNSGDSVVFWTNSSSTGQFAYVNILEI